MSLSLWLEESGLGLVMENGALVLCETCPCDETGTGTTGTGTNACDCLDPIPCDAISDLHNTGEGQDDTGTDLETDPYWGGTIVRRSQAIWGYSSNNARWIGSPNNVDKCGFFSIGTSFTIDGSKVPGYSGTTGTGTGGVCQRVNGTISGTMAVDNCLLKVVLNGVVLLDRTDEYCASDPDCCGGTGGVGTGSPEEADECHSWSAPTAINCWSDNFNNFNNGHAFTLCGFCNGLNTLEFTYANADSGFGDNPAAIIVEFDCLANSGTGS